MLFILICKHVVKLFFFKKKKLELWVSDSPDLLYRNSCDLQEHKAVCENFFFIHGENRSYSL